MSEQRQQRVVPEDLEERGEGPTSGGDAEEGAAGTVTTDVPLGGSSSGKDPPEESRRGATENESSNRRKKKLFWTGGLAILVATIGLIIGLSVGLTNRRDDSTPPLNAPDDYNTAGEGTGIGSLRSATLYTSTPEDAVPWRLQSFSDYVLGGYEDCDGLREDLGQAAAYLANVVIRRNAEFGREYGYGYDDVAVEEGMPEMAEAEEGGTDSVADQVGSDSDGEGGGEGGGEDAWETNTQVEGVDEADAVKSDGKVIFAAYGDRIVHFDTSGSKLSETIMPAPYFDEEACKGDYWGPEEPYPAEAEASTTATMEDSGGRSGRARRQMRGKKLRGGNRKASMVADEYYYGPYCYRPRARIESMLLEDGKLIVVVSGYNQGGGTVHDPAEQPILGDVGTTKVRLYDVNPNSFVPNEADIGDEKEESKFPQLKLLGSRDLPGYYAQKGGRSIGSRAYLVSHNYVDTWYHFQRHFDRWQILYDGLTDDEYIEVASQYAIDTVIPIFVDKLMTEIQDDDVGDCSHIAQVSMFQSGDVDARSHQWWDNGIFNGLTQVTSIDLSQEPTEIDPASAEPLLQAEKSVAFVPSTWSTTVYATQDMIFLATQGYDQHPQSRWGFIESTYIFGFSLDGGEGPARGVMVGKVGGTLLNSFSMDMHNGFLRVATTTWAEWVCPPFEETGDVTDEEEAIKAKTTAATADGEEDIELIEIDDVEQELEPVFCEDTRFRGPSNQVTILSANSGVVMNQVGYLGSLGKPGESIYAVRFMKDKGFVVTFQRTDPFYTLDLSDPFKPQAVGELEISGFSNYIHPTEDPNVLIAVGEDADERGRVLGVQLTLFGVHDFNNPTLIARYNIEQSDEQWSSSEVQWDHRAFRYLAASQRVILPAEVRGHGSYESFDGFYIFKIDKENADEKSRIQLKHRISLAPDEEELWTRCYSPARLAARSMVFQGDAMLMKNHAIESHDLDAPQGQSFLWHLDMDEPATEEDVRKGECNYWW